MFGRFLDWFERHKVGIIGTLMLHTCMLFTMALSKLPKDSIEQQQTQMVMELAAPVELPPDPMLQPPTLMPTDVKNVRSNTTAEIRPEQMNISRGAQERISNDVEEDLKAFETEQFTRLDEERKAAGKEVRMPTLDTTKWNKERYMKKEPVKVKGLTTVRYDLVGRADLELDVPAYLCRGQGQVAILVSVDQSGVVRKADLDPAGTTTLDECMRENALRSAQAARFTSSSSAPDPQKGTITYIFLAQ